MNITGERVVNHSQMQLNDALIAFGIHIACVSQNFGCYPAWMAIPGKKYWTVRPITYPSRAAPTAIKKNSMPERKSDLAARWPLKTPTENNVTAARAMER